MNKVKISLQPTEGLIYQVASRIYIAHLEAGRVKDGQEKEWMERCLRDAIQFAQLADRAIRSDSELD